MSHSAAQTSRPIVSRRTVLASGGALTLTAAGSWWAPRAHGEEVGFATLRERYRELLMGTDFDRSDPLIAAGIDNISQVSVRARAALVTTPERDRIFSDVPLTASAGIVTSFGRLMEMARAYRVPGATGFDDPQVAAEVIEGLRTMESLIYHAGADEFDNWWHWEIGGPVNLAGALILLDGLVPAEDLAKYVAALDWFVADPALQFQRYPNRTELVSTGTNRVDLCRNAFLIGLVGESDAHMNLAADRLTVAFQYGSEGDPADGFYSQQGLYSDGSFLYQGRVPYTGSYGIDMMTGLSRLLGLLAGSPWEMTDPRVSRIIDGVDAAFVPIVFSGQIMDGVRGRSIARTGTPANNYANSLVEAILRLSPAADDATAARWRNICAGWLDRSAVDILVGASLPRISLVKQLRADPTVTPTPEPATLTLFPRMARAVHRGPGWACMVSAASDRVSVYDYQLGENYRGYHTAAGWTQLYLDSDSEQYIDEFWPTVDLHGLAGTTVDTAPVRRGAGGTGAGKTLAPNAWAGGVQLSDSVGSFGQHLHGVESRMTARQSWFFLPNMMVALGASITGGSGQPIITTVEHRKVDAEDPPALTVNGEVQPDAPGWTASFDPGSWAHLESVAGYVMLDRSVAMQASRAARTGSWRDVNDNASTDEITRSYATLWLDHGRADVPYETVVDTHTPAPGFEKQGSWVETTTVRGVNGGSVLATSPGHAGNAWCVWQAEVPTAGRYEVQVWFPAFHNNPPSAPYTVSHQGGDTVVTLDQTVGGRSWQGLGEYDFARGPVTVRMDVDGSGFPKADAIRVIEPSSGASPGPDSRYAYVLLPGASVAATQAMADAPTVQVLANTDTVQAIQRTDTAVVLANFFAAGTTRRLTADGPCAVALSQAGATVELGVSDPTASRDQVRVDVVLGRVRTVDVDSTVRIERTEAVTSVIVDTSERDGRTHRVTLRH